MVFVSQAKKSLYSTRKFSMESVLKGLRHSLRMFRSSQGFTLTAVAALALGIGSNTAIFSVVNAVLLKPLPAPDPDKVVIFLASYAAGVSPMASEIKFNLWREQTSVFQLVSASRSRTLNLTGVEEPEQVRATFATADYFRLFGLPIAQGRRFTAEDERPGSARVAVLGYPFWRRAFGGDPGVLGKTISLADDPYRVIGILADGIQTEPPDPPDIWAPLAIAPNSTDQLHYFQAVARLRPGVTLAQANAQLQLTTQEFRRKFPSADATARGDVFSVQPLQQYLVKDVRTSLLTLAGAVSLVLFIACANVANLLLVRTSARSREVAIRTAVGASRARLVRQLLTESVTLAITGGLLGLGIGQASIRILLSVNPSNIPRLAVQGSNVSTDWRVLAFTAFIAVGTGLLFGLVPALQTSGADLTSALKDGGGRTGGGLRQNRVRSVLVVAEMGLALVLLIGAALLIRALVALRSVDPGFDPHNVVVARAPITPRMVKTPGVEQLVRDIEQRLDALPGVERVGFTRLLPMDGGFNSYPIVVAGRPLSGPLHGTARWMVVSPGYFDALKIRVLRGRSFTDSDGLKSPSVAIVNQSLAREVWPGGDPLNDRIFIRGLAPNDEPARQVVGIVGDVRENGLGFDLQPAVFVPVAQVPDARASGSFAGWVVRTRAPSATLNTAIRNELRLATGGAPIAPVRSMEEIVLRSTDRQDFNMLLMTVFGGSALLLGAIGIYGLMAYSAQQRIQEMGVRMALGATAEDVRNMIVWQGMRLALAGVAIGVAAAFGLTRFLASLLSEVRAWDPLVFILAPVFLSAVGLAAVWLPARRASLIDPIRALHYE